MKYDHELRGLTSTCVDKHTYSYTHSFFIIVEENSTPDPFIPTEEMPLHPNLQTSKAFKLSKPF